MASRKRAGIVALGALVIAVVAGGYLLWRPEPAGPVVGVVRATEVRVAPEVGGQLAAIKVQKGARVRAGDVVAELSAFELSASVGLEHSSRPWSKGPPPQCLASNRNR